MRKFLLTLILAVACFAQNRVRGSSDNDQITATVRGTDGFIYATGVTNSPDFPTTIETASRPAQDDYRPFVLKLDSAGKVIYSTLIEAPSASSRSITVNSKGEVLIGGQSVELGPVRFPQTPGAVAIDGVNTGFLVKLNAAGRMVLAIRGLGNGPVAFDGNDNIYVAGSAYGDTPILPTASAFQSTHANQACGGTGFVGFACSYQYVAKISADGAKLLYSTFITGAYGASPSALLIDPEGNALVAGTTNSPDYPVTEGSFQTQYRVAKPPPPRSSFRPSIYPPPPSGYLTKLNAGGTALIWSTYFSGTGAETIRNLRLSPDGGLFFAGQSASRDLPFSMGLPEGCPLGIYSPDIPYIAGLSADGKSSSGSRYVYDIDPYQETRIRVRPDGTAQILIGEAPAVDLETGASYLCMVDSADLSQLSAVAPGQLVTLFGQFTDGVSVRVGEVPAQLLFSSAEQINFQVPLTTISAGELTVSAANGSTGRRPFDWVGRAPSVFLDLSHPLTIIASCREYSFSPGYDAIVRNEDGSLNDCENPAPKGSIVTFYLNGLGATAPVVTFSYGGELDGLELESSGVWRMRVRLAANTRSGSLTPLIDGASLRYPSLAVWIAP